MVILRGVTYRIEEIDDLSMPGILQMSAKENFANKVENDVENDITNAWNMIPVIPEGQNEFGIIGPDVVKPLFTAEFEAIVSGGTWYIEENEGRRATLLPVEIIDDVSERVIHIKWNNPKSGSYTLCYRLPDGVFYKRHIIVESLF